MFERALAPARQTEGSRSRGPRLHILVLTDRDWTHPQAGGTGTHLRANVSRWLEWGHRVTVVASAYPGAVRHDEDGDLTVHRMGGRTTLFPRAIWKVWRGLVPDADVALEVINGITFLTPLWLRIPRLALVHHVHREHYRDELGLLGRIAAYVLETMPLRRLYRGATFVTVSQASAADVAAHGIPERQISVSYNGVDPVPLGHGPRTLEPSIVHLGRLKRYKRIEALLDVVEEIPGATLDIVGEGDHRQVLELEIASRELGDRVRLHGFVDERTKMAMLRRSWVHITSSPREGWGLSVMEAATCGTPTVAIAAGGLRESIVHGQTGLLAEDVDELAALTRQVIDDPDLRERLGSAALMRSHDFNWNRSAETTLRLLARECGTVAVRNGRPTPVQVPAG